MQLEQSIHKDQFYLDLKQSLVVHPLRLSQIWGKQQNYDNLAMEYHLDSNNTLKGKKNNNTDIQHWLKNEILPLRNKEQSYSIDFTSPKNFDQFKFSESLIKNNNNSNVFTPQYTDSILKDIQNQSFHQQTNKDFDKNASIIHPQPDQTEKFKIYLCADIGLIYGILTISNNLLIFEPDIEKFKQNYPTFFSKHHSLKKSFLSYQFQIDVKDIFTFSLSQQVHDVYANNYDIYMHIFLEECENEPSPITDENGNLYVLKLDFKTVDVYYSKSEDSDELDKTYFDYIAKKIINNSLKQQELDTNYKSSSVVKCFEKVNIRQIQQSIKKKSRSQKKNQIDILLPNIRDNSKIFEEYIPDIIEDEQEDDEYQNNMKNINSLNTIESMHYLKLDNKLQQTLQNKENNQNDTKILNNNNNNDNTINNNHNNQNIINNNHNNQNQHINDQNENNKTFMSSQTSISSLDINNENNNNSNTQNVQTIKQQKKKNLIFQPQKLPVYFTQKQQIQNNIQQQNLENNINIPFPSFKKIQKNHKTHDHLQIQSKNDLMSINSEKKINSFPNINKYKNDISDSNNKQKNKEKSSKQNSQNNLENYGYNKNYFNLSENGKHQFKEIVLELPTIYSNRDWYLLFSPNKHGYSYNKFLRRNQQIGPHIILIKDTQKVIFGAFVTEGWQKKNKYYGTGESFLFTLKKGDIMKWGWNQDDDHQNFQFCSDDGISLGMGQGIGLFIQNDFYKGTSQKCATYGNQQLTKKEHFTIQEFEIWGFEQYENEGTSFFKQMD